MFELAVWKIMFGAVGVVALLGIPVVLWMRRRALQRTRRSAHARGGDSKGGSRGSALDSWEDVSSRFIDDFIPDVDEDREDEDRQEAAQSGSVREVAANSSESLDDVEEGVRIIEVESREVLTDETPPAEGEAPPGDDEKPVSGADKAPASETDAPWWDGLSEPVDAEYPREADELMEASLVEPPASPAKVDSETRFEEVLDDEEMQEAAEVSQGAGAPLRMRIPAVSEVRVDAPAPEEEGEEEVLRLTREGEGVADAPAEPAREDRDDEAVEAARESRPEPQFEEHVDEPPRTQPEEPAFAEAEPDEAPPDSQVLEPEEGSSPPEPEEESAPAPVAEEDVISLIQRERAEDEDFSQSAALQEEPGVAEDTGEIDFPLDDDVEELVPGEAAPLAASHETPANTPSELIRELVADFCPGDLLLAEDLEHKLPAWTPGVVNAAGIDLGQRERTRQTPASEEYLRLAILEMILGRNQDATEHLKESLRRASRLAPVLNALAVASYLREKVEPAISYSREAFREAGRDVPVQAVISRNMGYFYQRKGDDQKAAESYEKTIDYIGPQGALEQLSTLRMRVGRLFRRLGDKEKAREHLSEAAHLFHRSGDRRSEARAHTALASVLTETGEYEAAQVSLDGALNLCQKIGDKAGEALVYSQMGVSFAAQEQFTRALRYYENALRLNRGLENRKAEAANLSGMGNIHYARGDLPEARESYEAALEINREQGSVLAQGVALGSLGRVHFEGREWEASRECLTEARRIFLDLGAAEALDSIMELLRALEKHAVE